MEIVPLSKENWREASNLVVKVFKSNPKDDDYPPRWFKASLNPERYKELYKKFNNKKIKYYVAVGNKKIIGTTGFYVVEGDNDSYWLGWWCVDPKYRGKGIGKRLLRFIINKAKKSNKKFLRLYTSNDKNEMLANKIYDKLGFKITKTEPRGGNLIYCYRELKIKKERN